MVLKSQFVVNMNTQYFDARTILYIVSIYLNNHDFYSFPSYRVDDEQFGRFHYSLDMNVNWHASWNMPYFAAYIRKDDVVSYRPICWDP